MEGKRRKRGGGAGRGAGGGTGGGRVGGCILEKDAVELADSCVKVSEGLRVSPGFV